MVQGQESMQDVLLNGSLDSVIDSLGDSSYIKQVVEQTQNQQLPSSKTASVAATMRSKAAVSQGVAVPNIDGIANVVAGAATAAQMLDAMNAVEAMQRAQNAGQALGGANIGLTIQPSMATIELPAVSDYDAARNQVQQESPAPVLNQVKNRLPAQQLVAAGGMPSSPGNAAAQLRRAQQQSRVDRDTAAPQSSGADSAPSRAGVSTISDSGADSINPVGVDSPQPVTGQADNVPTAEDIAQAGRTLERAAESAQAPQSPEAFDDTDDTDTEIGDVDGPEQAQPQIAQPTQQAPSQPAAGDSAAQDGFDEQPGEQIEQPQQEDQSEEDVEDVPDENQEPKEGEDVENQEPAEDGESVDGPEQGPETPGDITDPGTGELPEGIQPTNTNLGGSPTAGGGAPGGGVDLPGGATPEISKLPANSLGSSATKGASNAASSIAKDQASKRLKQQAGKQLKKQAAKQVAKKSATVAAEAALGPEILAAIGIVLAVIALIGVWVFMLLFIVWLLDQGDLGFIREIIGLGISNFLTILEGLMSILSSIVF